MSSIPYCVDLDGTLIKTDMLFESLIRLFKKNIFFLFLIPIWLLKGRAYLKQQIARHVDIDPETLPYHDEYLNHLKEEHQNGTELILATGSDESYAKGIAKHLGIFRGVIASDGKNNISGHGKEKVLLEKYGDQGFDYSGNSWKDIHIWKHANQCIIVNGSNKLINKVKKTSSNTQTFHTKKFSISYWKNALRIHQWVKNILIFTPLFMAHQIMHIPSLMNAMIAFLSFSLCASGIYILNDLIDLESDRHHPTKKLRPFASCQLSISDGLLAIPILFILSITFAQLLPVKFCYFLFLYVGVTLIYTFFLKKVVLLDVILLAALYTLRIMSGSAAILVPTSSWLMAFAMFFFLSLALIKRYSELYLFEKNNENNENKVHGRGYSPNDLGILPSFGASSGYTAVLVLALYINSPKVSSLYQSPKYLWLICPLLLYWISRIWMKAYRGLVNEDPIIFAIKDKVSYFTGFVALIILLLATLL